MWNEPIDRPARNVNAQTIKSDADAIEGETLTTLAWDGKTLAADKQATNNGYRATVTKLRRLKDGSIAGICGELEPGLIALEYLEGGSKPVWLDKDDWPIIMLVRRDGTLWRYEKYLTPFNLEEQFTACGSGRDYALAAMACGKSAKEAVEIAIRFDCNSGMGVDSLCIESSVVALNIV